MSSKVNIDQSKQMFVSNGRRQQILNEQRKRLQQLRLQTQSQNTKLLKIQQKEREVESQYQNEKKNMDNTLAKLSVQAQQFARKQKIITREFENQKEQIFTNDRKKETYLKQKQQLQQRNKRRRHQIQQKQEKLNQKRIELQYIRTNIKKYQIYEEFLKQFRNMSDEFATSQVDQYGVMSILQRYFTMEKKKSELIQRHKKIQNQKEIRSKKIQKVKKQKEQKILQFNSKIKDLKQKIDSLNEQNQQLESQLEGKLNEIGQRQRQIGQVIFSIRGLYQSIAGQQKQAYKSTIEMLKTIREQRKRLRQYLDLFTEKNKEKRTV